MKIALYLLALLPLQTPVPDTSTFSSPKLGLMFSHPKSWTLITNKKGDTSGFIPLDGSTQPAKLEIYPVAFDSDQNTWQLSQESLNKTMKREVVRQWSEEILGVPLLLTKVSYADKNGSQLLLTGLVYSRTARKMMFRLTAAPDDYDKAELAWRTALQSLRTYNGAIPQAEDPTIKRDPKKPVEAENSVPTKLTVIDGGKPAATPKGALKNRKSIDVATAGRKLVLRFPAGWAAAPSADGSSITFTYPEISTPVKVTIASSLDSDSAPKALFRVTTAGLDSFAKVTKRDERLPENNLAGAALATVWRLGATPSGGTLLTCDATGANGDFYFMLAFRCDTVGKMAAERKAIEALLDQMSIDPPAAWASSPSSPWAVAALFGISDNRQR